MAATTEPSSPGLHGADVGDQPALADRHLDLASDLPRHRDRGIAVVGEREQLDRIEPRLRARAGDVHDRADRIEFLAHDGHVAAGMFVFRMAGQLVDQLPETRIIFHDRPHLLPLNFVGSA